ncbi:hypothetical protein [Tenggerimyces flavus]|uniref:Uncharacterized protein n=1 Tax=Tenggerimyces flavus TaxID=1708749 RepID=A0ABV7Y7Q6_9ACTN|nr:hypothetical protein [Tenggerimyces flavus]MBM7785109.1 hypothetical protein [Tenggerimyces flavus]
MSPHWAIERSYRDVKSSSRIVGREDFYESGAERSRSDVLAELLERFAGDGPKTRDAS